MQGKGKCEQAREPEREMMNKGVVKGNKKRATVSKDSTGAMGPTNRLLGASRECEAPSPQMDTPSNRTPGSTPLTLRRRLHQL
jgi:hypothetical protein